jgi:hypothetical protein
VGTSRPKAPVLLVGAGLSYSLVPQAAELVNRLAPVQAELEDSLGIPRCEPMERGEAKQLYKWAERVVKALVDRGCSDADAKRKLARVLGVTTDACWSAKAQMPLRGTSARHRVIARLTREAKWHSLWSLNWDVWLERAMESAGLERHSNMAKRPLTLPSTWIRWYETWVPPAKEANDDQQTIVVYKPHGCVDSLLSGSGVLVLTEEELQGQLDQLPAITRRMVDALREHPLISAGWSASEPYLVKLVSSVKGDRADHCKLTIIDPFPNDKGHRELEDAYGAMPIDVECVPSGDTFPSTDDTFLWVQTRHGLSCLLPLAEGRDRDFIEEALNRLREPVNGAEAYLVDWFDNFLPVWSRLCFNNGRQKFYAGQAIKVEAIPTHRRDEHIPWNCDGTDRLDLRAAVRLLAAIGRSRLGPAALSFDAFPGALWNNETQALIVPVPSWEVLQPQSLQALKPLVESRHWSSQGRIRSIGLLGLQHADSPTVVDPASVDNWRYELARLMHFSHFADPTNIEWMTLADWEASL